MSTPTPDQPSLVTIAIQVAQISTKVDTLIGVQSQHGIDIRALMERRWPLPVLSALIGLGGLGALIIPHLK